MAIIQPPGITRGAFGATALVPSGGETPLPLAAILGEQIRPETFGAKGDGVTDDYVALQKAFDLAWLRKGSVVALQPVAYAFTRGLVWHSNLTVIGLGVPGDWVPDRVTNMGGSTLLAKGAALKEQYAYGITDERTSGGRIDNTGNARFAPTDSYLALGSYYNEDANPTTGAAATAAPFSAAVTLPPGSSGITVSNVRILLNFNGTDGYTNKTLTLADDWDVGLYVNNSHNNNYYNVQVLGYWRKNGALQRQNCLAAELPAGLLAGCERNVFQNCIFQGWESFAVRGSGMWAVTGVGADWVEVPWAANHPFDINKTTTVTIDRPSATGYTFTGTQINGDKLRLTGVSPSPSTVPLASPLYMAGVSNGLAGATLYNCLCLGMWHTSQRVISDPAIAGALPPSAALVVSGSRVRGFSTPFTKFQPVDDRLIHLHQCIDTGLGPKIQLEASTPVGSGVGARMIATPNATTRVPYPVGSTFRVSLDIAQMGGDFTPAYGTRNAKFTTDGFWQPTLYGSTIGYFGLYVGGESEVNKLTDINDNTYTTSITCATPGDLALTSQARSGDYAIRNKICNINSAITVTVTYTTATGEVRLNLPFAAQTKTTYRAVLSVVSGNIPFGAGYTHISARVSSGQNYATFILSGSGVADKTLLITDIPTGTRITLDVGGQYVKA